MCVVCTKCVLLLAHAGQLTVCCWAHLLSRISVFVGMTGREWSRG
jgi:hypothetical protein